MTRTPEPFAVERLPGADRDHAMLAARGELDMATADRVRAEVDALLASGVSAIVLDLRGVTFLDSTGLRMLFAAHDAAERGGVRLAVVDGDPRVSRVLEITGAWRVLRRADRPTPGVS